MATRRETWSKLVTEIWAVPSDFAKSMLLSLLAFAIPALDKPIDFRPDVATVPNLVAKLAKQSGLRLTTGKTVTNDVVAVVAPYNSPREIMDQIAYAIEAEWKESGGEWTLFRSDAMLKDQAKRDKAITSKEIEIGRAHV